MNHSAFEDLVKRQTDAWDAGRPVLLDDLVLNSGDFSGIGDDDLLDVVYRDICSREQLGLPLCADSYSDRFPELMPAIECLVTLHREMVLSESLAPPVEAGPKSFGDRYEFIREIGSGGIGRVDLCFDNQLLREVAVKRLLPRHHSKPHYRNRLLREATLTAALQHSTVIPVYDIGHDDDDNVYFSMTYVRGDSLAEYIERVFPATGSWQNHESELRRIVQRLVFVCHAAAAAHEAGIVHRDIKPANILLGSQLDTWLVDWGLSRRLRNHVNKEGDTQLVRDAETQDGQPELSRHPMPDSTTRLQLTLDGSRIGTPGFMSPEQTESPSDCDELSDVYSLGASLNFVLNGKVSLHDGVASPPADEKLKALHAIAEYATHPTPQLRYANAAQMAGDLEAWLADEELIAIQSSLSTRVLRWARTRKTLALGISICVLSVLMGLMIFLAQELRVQKARNLELSERMNATERFNRVELIINSLGTTENALAVFQQSPVAPAFQNLQKVIKAHFAESLQGGRNRNGQEWIRAAICCSRVHAYSRAEEFSEKGLGLLNEADSDALEDFARGSLLLCELKYRRAEYSNALKLVTSALSKSAELETDRRELFWGMLVSRAACFIEIENYDEAYADLNKVLSDSGELMFGAPNINPQGFEIAYTCILKASFLMAIVREHRTPSGFEAIIAPFLLGPPGYPGANALSCSDIYLLSLSELKGKMERADN